jgi:hypothetical protein
MRVSLTSSFKTAVIALAMAAGSAGAQSIGSGTPTSGIDPFGFDSFYPSTFGTVGQTFIASSAMPILTSFRFYLTENFGGADLRFVGSVYAYSTDHIVGPALYTSTVRSGSSNTLTYDSDQSFFSGLNVLLTGGNTYAFLLQTTATSPDGASNIVGTTIANSVTTGTLITSPSYSESDLQKGGAFIVPPAGTFGADAALIATFSANVSTVPEPSSVVLLAAGLAGVVVVARRRRVVS